MKGQRREDRPVRPQAEPRVTRTDPRRERGSTLLEIAVAFSLLALTVGGIYAFVVTGGKSARVTNNFLQTQAQLRAALDNVVDEIRWAQSVTAASASSVTLFIPQNTPFSTSSPYEVTFAYDATADVISRQVDPDAGGPQPAGPSEPLAYGVVAEDGSDGALFEYFDAAGSALGSTPSDLDAVARVRLTISTTRDDVTRVFTGDAALRAR